MMGVLEKQDGRCLPTLSPCTLLPINTAFRGAVPKGSSPEPGEVIQSVRMKLRVEGMAPGSPTRLPMKEDSFFIALSEDHHQPKILLASL